MRAVFAGVLIGLVVGGAALAPATRAQPAPDLQRAKDLYVAAETAMTEGRYPDAIRDYGAAFDLTRDPILFYKIANAHEKAGKCDVALIYYGRYLKEGSPTEQFAELTRERVRACGGGPPVPAPGPGSAERPATGSASAPIGGGSDAGSAAVGTTMTGRDRGAWLLVATSVALVTIGSVLAYAANSAESDITDLYVGFTGMPARYDDDTRETYEELIAEGRRYERLSWLSFGLAGATAIGAIMLLKTGRAEGTVQVAPTASPTAGGVSATLRW